MFKSKVIFYMKSGNIIVQKFDHFEMSRLSGSAGSRTMKYTGNSNNFTIDINQIECVIIEFPWWHFLKKK